jgi:hypothetical protein
MLDEKMRYELSERFRTGGLRVTPRWRWGLYAILFATAVGFLGKTDRFLLYAAPIAALLIVLMFAGMSKALNMPHVRAWVLGNLWWIIPLFMLMQIALFVWDRIEERKKNGDRPLG